MKIVENTADMLVLEDRPVLLTSCLWFMGLVLIASMPRAAKDGPGVALLIATLGATTLLVAWYFFPFQRIWFDRKTGSMHRRIARITGARCDALPLTQIKSAAGQGNWSDGRRMERIVLLTHDDPYPLEFGFFGSSRKPQIDAINDWLKSAKPDAS